MAIKIGGMTIRPEIEKPMYWLHIAVLALTVLVILKFIFNHDMLSIDMFWKIGIAIVIGDVFAHSMLKLD